MLVSYNKLIAYLIINYWLYFHKCQDTINALSSLNNTLSFIYRGDPIGLGEVPYQVALKCKDPTEESRYYTFCGGTIIGATKILTAAHCFVQVTYFLLIFPETDIKPLNDVYAVAATLRNLAYTRSSEHEQWRSLLNMTYPQDYSFPNSDIAIVFVTEPFKFNQYVAPIAYAVRYSDFTNYCLVSGYGQISYNIDSDSLLQAYLKIIPRRECSINHRSDTFHFICTSKSGPDIRMGDSGGPMVCSNTGDPMETSGRLLVGIASGSTLDNMDSFFTRVSSYRDFIESNKCYKFRCQLFHFIIVCVLQYNIIISLLCLFIELNI